MGNWSSTGTHRTASLKCGHLFGSKCIKLWLKDKGKNGICPICKLSLRRLWFRWFRWFRWLCRKLKTWISEYEETGNLGRKIESMSFSEIMME
ncbi:hypothetical protein BCR33DRAFT_716369 [Rhizoclosmatium globosum]|uniref:RING-type domain-containing protein n=1 Tax=Rhizoclosmatium globosum TaxID=329046 RepID=A0A1Y2CFZ8_9FUNG|nr:hypothetical protein BCR33DRAFT_716369 [Rhizoclosmatium globosum]|eukprot:ORY45744.1 hypothetical protein BCR33DRAFT_716369 [Rhizoclosmatium globosum]